MAAMTTLRHGRVALALHELRAGTGRPLLLLHGLGERSPEKVPSDAEAWSGPVHALDFTGHGQSTITVGGGFGSSRTITTRTTPPATRHVARNVLTSQLLTFPPLITTSIVSQPRSWPARNASLIRLVP